jgi:putative membrane protein
MKKICFIAVVSFAAFGFTACNDAGSDDAIASANESNEVKLDSAENTAPDGANATTVSEEDAKFAVEAASGGMMEVQLGELAQQKASSQAVKDFGAMMVRDHSKANDELKQIAMKKSLSLPPAPGEDHMDHIKELSAKSGKEFDKDYVDMMVKDHEKDVEKFEKCSQDAKDPELKAFASKTLPVLREHLEAVKNLQASMK